MAGVHMHRRHMRRTHMGDKRDAARPEARIIRRARNVGREIGGKCAVHGRDIDADFFENTPLHDRHHTTAAIIALPRPAFKPARRLA